MQKKKRDKNEFFKVDRVAQKKKKKGTGQDKCIRIPRKLCQVILAFCLTKVRQKMTTTEDGNYNLEKNILIERLRYQPKIWKNPNKA